MVNSNQSSKKKKETKRSRATYPGLEPRFHAKPRWELFDQDYIDKLSDKDRDWLSRFNEEWIGANFHHPGKKLMKSKSDKKNCYDRNNARNRDTISILRTTGWKDFRPDYIDDKQTLMQEDAMIDLLDSEDTAEYAKFVGKKKSTK